MSEEQASESTVSRSQSIKEDEMTEEKEASKKVSRRQFVKGAAVGGAGVAAAGVLASCAPAATPAPGTAAPAPTCPPAAECAPCPSPWLPEKWDGEADVVVLGAGLAGLCASIEAADAGASVILLEKMSSVTESHSTLCAGVINASASRLQAEAGFTETADDHYEDFMKQGGTNPRLMPPELVRIFVDNGGPDVDWLQDMGVPFNYVCLFPPDSGGRSHCLVDEETFSPTGFGTVPEAVAKEKGVEILYDTRAMELYRWADGSIAGVRAETKDGESVTYMAKRAVILSSGDMSNNPELKLKSTAVLKDTVSKPRGGPGNTGDGLIMAMAVGADSLCLDSIGAVSGLYSYPLRSGTGSWVIDSGAIIVNNDGKRFENESKALGGAVILDQPGGVASMIFDSVVAADETLVPEGAPLGRGPWIAYCRYLDMCKKWPFYKEADTIEELAEKLGVSASGLAETVDKYNGYVATGTDPDFERTLLGPGIKTPPFYGIGPGEPMAALASGTLMVNEQHQVLDVFGEIIPRLYAAGDMGKSGMVAGHGTHMGWAMVSGRRSGRFAAAEAPKE